LQKVYFTINSEKSGSESHVNEVERRRKEGKKEGREGGA
jgi:hypothetical protein